MAEINEASPICRGKNLTWETVLLFFNNMPKQPLAKADFNKACESKITGWTQTHSQIARQMALYYEENGICYPRFEQSSTMQDLLKYVQSWACNYFVPNPFCPSLAGKQPIAIYQYLSDCIDKGMTDFHEALDNMLHVKLSSHDKVKVYINDFTDIVIDEKGNMSRNMSVNVICRKKEPTIVDATDSKTYFDYFTMSTSVDIKEQFEYYLRNCINSTRRQGTQFRYGDSAVASYMSYMKADVFFAYNRQKWDYIKESLFEISGVNEIEKITSDLLGDDDFIKYDEGRGQWAIKTLLIYNSFIHAREYFKEDNADQESPKEQIKLSKGTSLQQIFYGAPGTGKSHQIDKDTESMPKDSVFRTTFHPDSDYSTFVGAYKPTMQKNRKKKYTDLSVQDLAKTLSEYYNDTETGKVEGLQKFCYEYAEYIDGEYNSINKAKLLELAGIPATYIQELNKYLAFCKLIPKQDNSKIVYTFVKQAFLKAYLKAWSNLSEDAVLVIEEINRGNCAQIFGDIFQLLDRNVAGYSDYPINADEDLCDMLQEEFSKMNKPSADVIEKINNMYSKHFSDIVDKIWNGEVLLLPNNLYIWATMNTSDQSLFPIDSAFKRRWDWKYMPIDEEKESWTISVNGKPYSWSSFLKKINKEIQETTSSEDKMLGFYFCKAENGVITEDRFVSKVLFYIYNDVFKDYGLDSREFFKNKEDGDKVITFQSLYKSDGTVNKNLVEKLLESLNVDILPTSSSNIDEDPEEKNVSSETKQLQEKFWQGFSNYRKNNEEFCSLYTERSANGNSMDLTFSKKAYHPYLGVLFSKNVARTGLWFSPGESNDAMYALYKQQEDKIKSIVEEDLEYKDGPNSHTIQASKTIDLKNENNWTAVYDWYMQLAIKYYKVKEELDK